jgi:hypothetical protein
MVTEDDVHKMLKVKKVQTKTKNTVMRITTMKKTMIKSMTTKVSSRPLK